MFVRQRFLFKQTLILSMESEKQREWTLGERETDIFIQTLLISMDPRGRLLTAQFVHFTVYALCV